MDVKIECIVLLFIISCTLFVSSQLLQCSNPILSSLSRTGSAYSDVTRANSIGSLPLLGDSDNAWRFTNNKRTLSFPLETLLYGGQLGYYITGIGIRTAASVDVTCRKETSLNLTAYRIIYRSPNCMGEIEIPDRSYVVQGVDREIRLKVPVQLVDNLEITRTGGYINDSAVYCVQFELYGCPVPSIQGEVLSYEYSLSNLKIFFHLTRYFLLPNFNPTDPRYLETGICDAPYLYCSGGIGILMDGVIGTSSLNDITNSLSIGFDCPNIANMQICTKHFIITLTQVFHVDVIIVHGFVGTYFGDSVIVPKLSLTDGTSSPVSRTNTTGNSYALEVEVNSSTRYLEFDILLDRDSIVLMNEIQVVSGGQNLAWLVSTYSPHSIQPIVTTTTVITQPPCVCEDATLQTSTTSINSTVAPNGTTALSSNIDADNKLLIVIIVMLGALIIQAMVNLVASLYGNIVSRSILKILPTYTAYSTFHGRLFSESSNDADKIPNVCDGRKRSGGYQPSPTACANNSDGNTCTGVAGCGEDVRNGEDQIYNPLYSQKYESIEVGYSTVGETNTGKTNPFISTEESIDLDGYSKLDRTVGKVTEDISIGNPAYAHQN